MGLEIKFDNAWKIVLEWWWWVVLVGAAGWVHGGFPAEFSAKLVPNSHIAPRT